MQPAPPDHHRAAGDRDEPFVNEPIDVSGLPRLPDDRFESLDPRYLRIRWTGVAITAAVVIVLAGIVTAVLPDGAALPRWIPAVVALGLLALLAVIAWLQRLEITHMGYLVRDEDFSYRSGVIGRSVVTVPFARIQHVSIDRGPLARSFGLATLQMRTAGSGGLTVPGMDHDTAQRLKALVADRAAAVADEELADLATTTGAGDGLPAMNDPSPVPPPIPPQASTAVALPPPPAEPPTPPAPTPPSPTQPSPTPPPPTWNPPTTPPSRGDGQDSPGDHPDQPR